MQLLDLLAIPSSQAFRFAGALADGIVIDSPRNTLRLSMAPVTVHLVRVSDETIIAWGSADAVLQLERRTIPGRVIYEYLVQRGKNPMVRHSLRTLSELGHFEGLYLVAGDAHDLYLQRTSRSLVPGLDPVLGFIAQRGQASGLQVGLFRATQHRWAQGLYRWPAAWRVDGRLDDEAFALQAESRAATTVFNWYIAGFAMHIVAGELRRGGEVLPVNGFAEVLALGGLVRKLTPTSGTKHRGSSS
jgi:hypothetical protein